MNWPIGYGRPGSTYETDPDGTLRVDGVGVTRVDGWITLAGPTAVEPSTLEVRVRLRPDADGRPFLYVDEVATPARRYGSVLAFVSGDGEAWGAVIAEQLHHAIEFQLAQRFAARRGERPPRALSGVVAAATVADDATPSHARRSRGRSD